MDYPRIYGARVVESVDTTDLGSVAQGMEVRHLSRAPKKSVDCLLLRKVSDFVEVPLARIHPMTDIHYHGTCVLSAADSLLAGNGLVRARPSGNGITPAALSDRVYITPSFALAAEYAFNAGRDDWPADHALQISRSSGWVFGFHADLKDARPDEDEMGHAVRAALSMVTTGEAPWSCMNVAFSDRVKADSEFRDLLLRRLRASNDDFLRSMVERDPRRIAGAILVRIGLKILDEMDGSDIAHALSLRPSLSVSPGAVPHLAYHMDRLQFSPEGLEQISIPGQSQTPKAF